MGLIWHVVQSKPRQELVAAENLRRQGFETYLPMLQSRIRGVRGWLDKVSPLFPRYLFIRVDFGQQNTAVIRSTRGAMGLLRFGSEPAVVSEAVIQTIRTREDAELGVHVAAHKGYASGERVRLVDGPFAGIEGIFASEDGAQRAFLLIELLGKTNRVRVQRDWLAAA